MKRYFKTAPVLSSIIFALGLAVYLGVAYIVSSKYYVGYVIYCMVQAFIITCIIGDMNDNKASTVTYWILATLLKSSTFVPVLSAGRELLMPFRMNIETVVVLAIMAASSLFVALSANKTLMQISKNCAENIRIKAIKEAREKEWEEYLERRAIRD